MISNYDDLSEADIDAFTEVWFSEETQSAVGQVLDKIRKKVG